MGVRFGHQLKEWREHYNVSQGALAAAVGKSRPYISSLENGRIRPPSKAECVKLAMCIGLPDIEAVWEVAAADRLMEWDPELYEWHLAKIAMARDEEVNASDLAARQAVSNAADNVVVTDLGIQLAKMLDREATREPYEITWLLQWMSRYNRTLLPGLELPVVEGIMDGFNDDFAREFMRVGLMGAATAGRVLVSRADAVALLFDLWNHAAQQAWRQTDVLQGMTEALLAACLADDLARAEFVAAQLDSAGTEDNDFERVRQRLHSGAISTVEARAELRDIGAQALDEMNPIAQQARRDAMEEFESAFRLVHGVPDDEVF